ncbi:MAG: hypothetical protein K940chlam4_01120, partial [Candidatus Anoxychlamydiales bacterium]|nr:hypothetical protein [Candidatus Anoxychlamydiales bacterium]
MKNVMKIAIGLMITATAVVSAQDQKEKYFKKDNSYKTTYVRFGSAAMPVGDSYVIAPGVAAGWQYRENKQGVDISVSGAKAKNESNVVQSFTLPKVQYLAFLQDNKPRNRHNAYLGLGGSLYGINVDQEKKNDKDETVIERTQEYAGLAANASIGYNYKLGKKLQSSIQLGANMPTPLAFNSKGAVYKPSFELS